jgi:hypothetical protein
MYLIWKLLLRSSQVETAAVEVVDEDGAFFLDEDGAFFINE